jgi:Lon-like protease
VRSRISTLLAAGMLAVGLVALAVAVPVPLVALGPGPTFNTLGKVDDKPVITVQGLPSYPPSGNLNLTTVSVTDRLTLVNVLGQWAAPDRQVVPRSAVYTPGLTDEEVQAKNAEDFTSSEINAESAAVQELGLPSVVAVADVVAGSAADGKLKAGDKIVTVDGTPVADPDAVNRLLQTTKPGDAATVAFTRDGAAQNVTVTLGSAPDEPRGVLGVVLARLPKDGAVNLDLGGIGGPSAGLMFSLGIVDVLTPGDLTGGRFIAGTGAITADGAVQNIGGIQFKMAAARAAGATVFVLPVGECAAAQPAVPPGLELVKVATLHDAVTALNELNGGRTPAGCP